jgi:gluconate 5-dehydrogenase
VPASKSALIQLAKSYAAELAKDGIRVNLLTPGWFPKPGKVERNDYITGITNRTPMGRIGLPKDLIGPVKFLLSDSSSFITGQNIIVDGGFSIY